jgi:hypothetical protein
MKLTQEQIDKLKEAHKLLDELTDELEPKYAGMYDEDYIKLIESFQRLDLVVKFGVEEDSVG